MTVVSQHDCYDALDGCGDDDDDDNDDGDDGVHDGDDYNDDYYYFSGRYRRSRKDLLEQFTNAWNRSPPPSAFCDPIPFYFKAHLLVNIILV